MLEDLLTSSTPRHRVDSEQKLQPELQILNINTSPLEYYRQLEGHGANILKTAEALWKESRKRAKRGEPDGNVDEETETDKETRSAKS